MSGLLVVARSCQIHLVVELSFNSNAYKEVGRKMKKIILAVAFMMGMVLSYGSAHAISFDLNNWNDPVLDASTDKVTVDVTTTGGITTLVFTWVSGNSGLTAIGMDK